MNPYLETLKDELREECGEDICQADWDEFYDWIMVVDDHCQANALMPEGSIEDMAVDCASWADGTRADLPSIVKYAYAAIEENLK